MVVAKGATHTFSTASINLVALTDFLVCESTSPTWSNVVARTRGLKKRHRAPPVKSKMAKFDQTNGHNPKITFGHKFALRILSQEHSSDLK